MNWESLLCMGDSITRGARSYLGYPEIAADMLTKSTRVAWTSWNFAWNGYRAVDLLRAVDEHRARAPGDRVLHPPSESVVVAVSGCLQ